MYALYVPTARRPVSGVTMERFASKELAARILVERNSTGKSKTFYTADGKQPWDRPPVEFPLADETGYMRVFLRKAKDPVPELLSRPDEEWVVREGGKRGVVERLPWGDGDESAVADWRRRALHVSPGVIMRGAG
jgi:hypothetical protein